MLDIALDLLREALHRRWILGLAAAITLIVFVLVFSLQMNVVDGVLSGVRLFGDSLFDTIRTAEHALQPVFEAAAWTVYSCGLLFGVLACSDFAPDLLTPGRIEHLLSLPLQRWQLLFGTYLGVLALAFAGSLYGSVLLTVLLGAKSGVWSPALLGAALGACVSFTAIYAAMLLSAVWVRSAAVSAAVGGALWLAGSVLTLEEFAAMLDSGVPRDAFKVAVGWLPRFWLIGHLGPVVGGYESMDGALVRALVASVLFGLACIALAVWTFERQDH